MDSSQPVQPQANTAQPAQQTVPVAAPAQPATNGGNKKLWIIVGLVLLILVIGGVYWYTSRQTKTETAPVSTTAPETVDSLENELNSTALDDLEKEFSSVDSDLQGL